MDLVQPLYLAYLAGFLVAHVLLELGARAVLRRAASLEPSAAPPPLSLIKPLHGVDAYTETCLESWLRQDYAGELQVIFSLQDPHDPALAVLDALRERPGLHPFEVMVNPIEPGFHGKGSNLLHGVRAARHPFLVLSDADTEAPPDALRKIAGELERGRELVSCPVLHDRSEDLWGQFYGMLWSYVIVYLAGPSLAARVGPMVAGGTVGVRAEALERIGGVEAYGPFLNDDVELGRLIDLHRLDRNVGPVLRSPVGRLGRAGWNEKMERLVASLRQLPLHPLPGMAWLAAYAYLPALPLLALAGQTHLVLLTLLWLVIRSGFAGAIAHHVTGSRRPHPEFVAMELSVAWTLLTALLAPRERCSWGGVGYRIGPRGEVLERS